MKKRLLIFALLICLFVNGIPVFAVESTKADIIILFENDVHCTMSGYPLLGALKNEMKTEASHVGVVSSGDFVQGSSLGVVSKGEYVINIMNKIGYDAVVPGNHEFDYKLPRLMELESMFNGKIVCCNFKSLADNKTVFSPYTIVSYGETEIAYIGITTPGTLTSSSPAQFLNEQGEYVYSFSSSELYETVQNAIDSAEKDGADYIIALSHLGIEFEKEEWMSHAVVKNTSGLDAVLDGHSHSVVSEMIVNDKNGNPVPIASTGTAFNNIGKLTIKDGKITTELIPVASLEIADPKISAYLEQINEEYKTLGQRKIGESKVKLYMSDDNGVRLIRNTETNLGNLCADAYRYITGSDIGLSNGGGIRANIEIGDITFNDILSIFPWNNSICVAEFTGQQIADALEHSVAVYPGEKGGFQHVSGLTFDFDPAIPSPVILDENESFVGIEGTRRVSDIKIWNNETKTYESLDLAKVYSVASTGYCLKEFGDGYSMFKNPISIVETGILDVELLEAYITEDLGGIIGEQYAQPQGRMNVLDEYIPLRKTFEEMGFEVIWTEAEPKKIVVNTLNGSVIFTADTNSVVVGETTYESDRTAYIENGVTYISADCISVCK